jgi:hypothetical protein
VDRFFLLALSLAIIGGCSNRKPPFSRDQFLAAKSRCGATDAYVVENAPNTIGFHGTSDVHINQAKCLKQALAETDVQTVVLGSRLYK